MAWIKNVYLYNWTDGSLVLHEEQYAIAIGVSVRPHNHIGIHVHVFTRLDLVLLCSLCAAEAQSCIWLMSSIFTFV